MKKLNVYYEEKRVGSLIRNEDYVYSFSYEQSWLKDKKSFPLSLAMPLQTEAFGNKVTLSFFENLLPEGEVRETIQRGHEIQGTYDFLKQFGQDCAGAVIISEKEKSPYHSKRQTKEYQIKMEKIFQAIDEKRSVAEEIAQLDPGYLSIAGAQDKFSAIYREGKLYLPTSGHPTTHIVKVPIYRSGVKESVYNEYFCMKLASLVGLKVPHCFVLDHPHHPIYIIERYDRKKVGNALKRVHQQDFCQAQGIMSENKYEAKGGPSLKDNYFLIQSNVTPIKGKRAKALFDYLDWVCFNLLIGNNDSHSKNLSFLLSDRKIELAPFYDLLSTAIYPSLKKSFSFIIGDRREANKIGTNQLALVDECLDLKSGTMNERAHQMKEKLLTEKDQLASELKKKLPEAKIIKRISNLISDRCKSLSRQGA